MAVLGLGATFFPQEALAYTGAGPEGPGVLAIQVAGALYLGFAFLNWMAQANLIGGIYSRPVAVGNFCHFTMAALALVKGVLAGQHAAVVVGGAGTYAVFAIMFGLVLFGRPNPSTRERE